MCNFLNYFFKQHDYDLHVRSVYPPQTLLGGVSLGMLLLYKIVWSATFFACIYTGIYDIIRGMKQIFFFWLSAINWFLDVLAANLGSSVCGFRASKVNCMCNCLILCFTYTKLCNEKKYLLYLFTQLCGSVQRINRSMILFFLGTSIRSCMLLVKV